MEVLPQAGAGSRVAFFINRLTQNNFKLEDFELFFEKSIFKYLRKLVFLVLAKRPKVCVFLFFADP